MKIINIIDAVDDGNTLRQRFLTDVQNIKLETCFNKRVAFNYEIDHKGISIGYPFEDYFFTLSFVNEELTDQRIYKYYSDEQKKWCDTFSKCIILTTYNELICSSIVKRRIWLYRHILSQLKREEDIWLLIYDVDKVINLNNLKPYEDTYIANHTILANCRGHHEYMVNPQFKDSFEKLNLLDFAQMVSTYSDYRNQVIKCDNVFFHWQSCFKSGLAEIIYALINILLDEQNFELTKISNNFKYNIMLEWLTKIFNSNPEPIHLAIIGSQGAGKTLLLRDLIQAIKIMGFKAGRALKYRNVFEFRPGKKDGKVDKTPIYAMRKSDIFDSVYTKRNIQVNMTFVNVPGDIFNEDRLTKTFNIYDNILKIKEKVFYLYEIKNNTGIERFVTFREIDNYKDKLPQEISSDVIHSGYYAKMHETLSFNGKLTPNNFDQNKIKEPKKINGKYIIEHYFEIDTDSIVNALYYYFDTYKLEGITPEEYFTDFSKDLSFHLYMQMATDFIMCDKLIRTDNGNFGINPEADTTLQTTCDMLNMFLEKRQLSGCNKYLAFRAADAAIEKKCFSEKAKEWNGNKKERNLNALKRSNYLYSLFCASLYKNLQLVPKIKSENLDKSGKYEYVDILDPKAKINLISHINHIDESRLVSSFIELQDNHHTFFTATPIDYSGTIFQNNAEAKNVADFGNFNIVNSLCFGSMQLAIDILKQHKSYPYEDDDTYGKILDNIFE